MIDVEQELRATLRDAAATAGAGPGDRVERVHARHRTRRRVQAAVTGAAAVMTSVAVVVVTHSSRAATLPDPATSDTAVNVTPTVDNSSAAPTPPLSPSASPFPTVVLPFALPAADTLPLSRGGGVYVDLAADRRASTNAAQPTLRLYSADTGKAIRTLRSSDAGSYPTGAVVDGPLGLVVYNVVSGDRAQVVSMPLTGGTETPLTPMMRGSWGRILINGMGDQFALVNGGGAPDGSNRIQFYTVKGVRDLPGDSVAPANSWPIGFSGNTLLMLTNPDNLASTNRWSQIATVDGRVLYDARKNNGCLGLEIQRTAVLPTGHLIAALACGKDVTAGARTNAGPHGFYVLDERGLHRLADLNFPANFEEELAVDSTGTQAMLLLSGLCNGPAGLERLSLDGHQTTLATPPAQQCP